MSDPRYVELLKNTVNEQDQEIQELKTKIKILENRIHELQQQQMFIDHTVKDIPELPDLYADPEKDRL